MRHVAVRLALAAALAGTAGTAGGAAAQDAVVDSVQMPAWLERDGRVAPLAPGMALESRDAVRTGPEARLLLKLAEGSSVKLGANAVLRLDGVAMRREDGVFAAAMKVLAGAGRRSSSAALPRARCARRAPHRPLQHQPDARGALKGRTSSPRKQGPSGLRLGTVDSRLDSLARE
ncbi:MAG: hypothetical protein M5U08_19400 [Burkholderiales bacterium]|nr:hypothetical protein [Burkholderiales bacterium]